LSNGRDLAPERKVVEIDEVFFESNLRISLFLFIHNSNPRIVVSQESWVGSRITCFRSLGGTFFFYRKFSALKQSLEVFSRCRSQEKNETLLLDF
jgi:hypothetical protein